MRLEVGPAEITLVPGTPAAVVAQVFNTDDVINAYEIRVYGVDPAWVELERDRLSLFPSSAGVVTVLVNVPDEYPAGPLELGIEVSPVVDPSARQLGTVTLVVAPKLVASMSADPLMLMAGRKATFNLTLANDGNAPVDLELSATDPEAKVTSTFEVGSMPPGEPARVHIVPGEQVIIPVRTKARPPLLGAPTPRMVTFNANGADSPLEAMVSFVQKPVLGRGLLSLFGMLMAITIFAVVLTTTLGRVVDVAKVDTALLKRAVEGAPTDKGVPDDPATVTGTVTLLSSGAGLTDATVELFPDDDPSAPVTSTVTKAEGVYTIEKLFPGSYKVRFRGVGFNDVWYGGTTAFEEAGKVDVAEGQTVEGINIAIGSLPGSIAGTVIGDDPSDAVVKLQVPAAVQGSATDALVKEATVGGDGTFLLEQVPAPASYELVVEKTGYATAKRVVNLGAAEAQEGIEVFLRRGDGVIHGIVVVEPRHPDAEPVALGGVSITATNTVDEVSAVSLTNGDDRGLFTLRSLPTPATYTVTFAKDGYATANLTIELGAAEERGPVVVQLPVGTGSISGKVTLADEGPVGGVTVAVSDGETTYRTESHSVGDVGSYIVTNLPIPGTYTVTFSGDGLARQVRSVDLDPAAEINLTGVNATLTAATATVTGRVSNESGPAGGVDVEISDGTTTLTTRSATAAQGTSRVGDYAIAGIPPGTYTLTFRQIGAVPVSVLLTVSAGERAVENVVLEPQAQISGRVLRSASGSTAAAPLAGVQVIAYRVADFPSVIAATAVTGDDGTYTLTNLSAPEEYIIEFAYPVGAVPQQSIRLELDAGQSLVAADQSIAVTGDA